MPDEFDRADVAIEIMTRTAIANAMNRTVELPAAGRCHNCNSTVPEGVKFCDIDCSEDWQYRKNLAAKRGVK